MVRVPNEAHSEKSTHKKRIVETCMTYLKNGTWASASHGSS